MRRPGYVMIKEAAAIYSVSRAKLHRLIKQGRIEATRDPRDERVKLLRKEELDSLFLTGTGEENEVSYYTEANTEKTVGRITAAMAARMDAIRERIAARGVIVRDSAEIIREEREKRSRHLYEVATGIDQESSAE
ncbi:MAG: helix-turn-helix domain-containing protein [Chloroflexi bacterium]|nr:helix-turn-helix domain-containing protein [Chloroflexota bacterium]